MRLASALKIFPKVVKLPLGITVANVTMMLNKCEDVPTDKEKYTFTASYNKRSRKFYVYIPRLHADGTYQFGGHNYVGVRSLEYPPVVVENRPRSRKLSILSPPSTPIIMTLFEGNVSVKRGKGMGDDISSPYLRTLFLGKRDRETVNTILGTTSNSLYTTEEDLKAARAILVDHPDYESDPKHIDYMRAMNIEEIMIRLLLNVLPRALYPFVRNGEIKHDLIHDAIDGFLSNSPQCQLYLGNNPMALLGLKEKLKVPMEPWASLDVARPHDTWEGAVCVVDTPQSSRAGEILALCHGAEIKEGKLSKGTSLLSSLLMKVSPFPHMIDPHRKVMMSAIAEQSCDLGENNESLRISHKDASGIAQPFGLYAITAIMDYGETHEDGCIISQNLADKLSTTVPKIDREVLPTGVEDTVETIVEVGELVQPGQLIMISEDEDEAPKLIHCSNPVPGVVTKIQRYEDIISGAKCNVIQIDYEITFECRTGSKISGLHSNKATVSRILPNFLMPSTEDGSVVDLIYSPASIAKRKIPSTVMEIMMNKLMIAKGLTQLETDGTETFEEVSAALAAEGLVDDATEQLTLGGPMPHRTLVGPLFIMMLHHHPETKLRIGGKVTHSFRGIQQRGVGQGRLNREELEILFQTGAHGLIGEIYDTVGRSRLSEHAYEYLRVLGVWKEGEVPDSENQLAAVAKEKLPSKIKDVRKAALALITGKR